VGIVGELGDYELLEVVGRGGQGVVYRAHQKSLNRTVALKMISVGFWATEAHLKRFRREAEAAASLEHPGIVPIYEVGERDGSCYFSMRFVEGGQLDQVIKREPMSIRQAAELISKVARTVHYAHEHGILHRDIKPGNILLGANGEPLLSDFGLARLVEAESTVTRTKEVMGTPSYMAPEQAMGNNAAVSSATDVYGLGAVLYQLLTGHPPFAGGTTYETIKLVLDTEPRQPRLLNPKIDRDLSTICLKSLEKDPKRRYSSALALAEDLEHWLKHEPIQARHTGVLARGKKWLRRNPARAFLVASLIALGAASGWIVWKSEFIRHPVTNGVAVLPFENLSPDSHDAYFADGIQDEILTRVSKISGLKVISRTSTQTYKNAPRNLREIGQQLGVSSILEGSVQKSADQIRVTVQLINAVTDSHLWAESYDRKFSDVFQVESDVAQKIASALEAKLTGREKSEIASVGTQNSQAYDAYLQARAVYREFTHDSVQRAVQALEEAVRLDRNFAAAWALLARMQAFAYFVHFDRTEMYRIATREAAETAIRLQPDLAEAQMAKGFYEYWVMDDYDAARRTFEQVQSRWPNNADILEPLGLIAFRQGRWKEAREYFDAAIALNPRDQFLRWNAFYARAHVRDFPAALRTIDQALAIWPDDTGLIAMKASIYQALGELDQAGALLSRLRPKPGDQDAGAVEVICDQAMLRRDPAAAITLLRTLLSSPNSLPPYLHGEFHFLLGQLEQLSGNANEARASFTKAREALEKELKQQPQDATLAFMLAQTLAGLGERETALRWADRAVELLPSSHDARSGPALAETRARIQARFGDGDRAIPTLKHLLEIPYAGALTPALLRLHPDFDLLRSDPRFQKLCEEKRP
jgi:serine/threonine protein kinase/tetratricopeptide (TPR) repeat protein